MECHELSHVSAKQHGCFNRGLRSTKDLKRATGHFSPPTNNVRDLKSLLLSWKLVSLFITMPEKCSCHGLRVVAIVFVLYFLLKRGLLLGSTKENAYYSFTVHDVVTVPYAVRFHGLDAILDRPTFCLDLMCSVFLSRELVSIL